MSSSWNCVFSSNEKYSKFNLLQERLVFYLWQKKRDLPNELKDQKVELIVLPLMAEQQVRVKKGKRFLQLLSNPVKVRKVFIPSREEIHEKLRVLVSETEVCVITLETIKKSWEMRLKYAYSYWDSLIVATAVENNCTTLYTEDMHDGQLIENGLKIINPFEKRKGKKK